MSGAVEISTGGPVLPPVGVAVIARLFNLTERRIQQLAKQGILSKTAHGKYDLLLTVREYVAHLHAQQNQVAADPDAMTPKERLDHFRAESEKLKLSAALGQVIPVDQFERELARAFKSVASTLESLPDVLERDAGLSGAAVERCQALVDRLREEMHGRINADLR